MSNIPFGVYLLVMAGTTYLIRMIPLVLMKRKIQNRFLLSLLHYIPYAVLAAMTVPAVFYAANPLPAAVGFGAAVLLAYRGKSLVQVAALSCGAVLITELFLLAL